MKEVIHLPPKVLMSIYLFFVIIFLLITIYLVNGFFKQKNHHKQLISYAFKGEIILIGEPSRGTCRINIKTDSIVVEMRGLNIARQVKEYNIVVGDFISKNANSPKLKFHKKSIENSAYFEFIIR